MRKRDAIYAFGILSVLIFLLSDVFALNSLAGEHGEDFEMQQDIGTVSGNDIMQQDTGTVSGNHGVEQGIGTASKNSDLEGGYDFPEITQKKEKILSLIVPEQMEVIINPWEMEGRTQVYSEEYIIKNCGEGDGQLILSISVCRAADQGIEIRRDSEGIHKGEEKKIYLEMNFGETDTVILAEGNYTYEKILGAGEELVVWFSGAVNENVSPQWVGDEIDISIVYLWENLSGISGSEEVPADSEQR